MSGVSRSSRPIEMEAPGPGASSNGLCRERAGVSVRRCSCTGPVFTSSSPRGIVARIGVLVSPAVVGRRSPRRTTAAHTALRIAICTSAPRDLFLPPRFFFLCLLPNAPTFAICWSPWVVDLTCCESRAGWATCLPLSPLDLALHLFRLGNINFQVESPLVDYCEALVTQEAEVQRWALQVHHAC